MTPEGVRCCYPLGTDIKRGRCCEKMPPNGRGENKRREKRERWRIGATYTAIKCGMRARGIGESRREGGRGVAGRIKCGGG